MSELTARMRRFVRFAATFLNVLACSAYGAELREMRATGDIQRAFPRAASVRVLNVWATWCVPCVAEMPDLRRVDEAFGAEVALVGVTLDDVLPGDRSVTKKKVTTFLDRHRVSFPNLYYIGSLDLLADALRFDGEVPLTVIYGRNGRELWRHQGRVEREALARQIRIVLRRSKQ